MLALYIAGFLLAAAGIILLLDLTPDRVTDDLLALSRPQDTLRGRVRAAKGKKKRGSPSNAFKKLENAVERTGKRSRFTAACCAAAVLLIAGAVAAVLLDNLFMMPVLAVACAGIPFLWLYSVLRTYEKRLDAELETALSIVTTSYLRSGNLLEAVEENLPYIRMPVQSHFKAFVGNMTQVSADTKTCIRALRDSIPEHAVFEEWCEALLACQDDRNLRDILQPIVSKMTDIRIVNSELQTMLQEARKEYYVMALLVVGNIPLLYILNRDWYDALLYSTPGKAVLAVCGIAILITFALLLKFTRPVKYRR